MGFGMRNVLVVSNARMLVDLAADGRLDTLLRPESVVAIPDVVRVGLIRVGDRKVLQWIKDHEHGGLVRVCSTKMWEDFIVSNATIELSETAAVDEIVERLQGYGKVVEILC